MDDGRPRFGTRPAQNEWPPNEWFTPRQVPNPSAAACQVPNPSAAARRAPTERGAARHAQRPLSPPVRARKIAARRPLAAALVLAGLLAAAGGAAGLVSLTSPVAEHPAPLRRTPAAGTGLVPIPLRRIAALPGHRAGPPVALPVALMIPSIGVRTRLIRLGLTPQGTLQVPASPLVAGWYTGSPRPGEIGSAVIAGHIDSYTGPGVFFRLRLLRRGDLVYVRRATGKVAVFRVYNVRMYTKNRFPTAAVYGPAPDAELRLITCGGVFDHAIGSYLSNVVVFGRQVGRRAVSR